MVKSDLIVLMKRKKYDILKFQLPIDHYELYSFMILLYEFIFILTKLYSILSQNFCIFTFELYLI